MIRDYGIIRVTARHIAAAAELTIEEFRNDLVEQEPSVTERLLARMTDASEKTTDNLVENIRDSLDGFTVKKIRWTAKTLTAQGRNAQEAVYGADFMGVLDIELEEYKVRKGFLAQAKIAQPEQSIRAADLERMRTQCFRMLDLSSAAFVFLYSHEGISVVPALSVIGAVNLKNPYDLYRRSVARFYEEHFGCFIGDHRIHSPNVEVLEQLRRQMNARRLLYLGARMT